MKLTQFEHEFDKVLTQHESFTQPKAVIRDNLYWAEQILLKQDDHYKVRLAGVECYIARNKFKPQVKGLLGNIIYLEDKICLN